MFQAFVVAGVVVGLSVVALGAALAPLCGDDDAAWSLGMPAALGVTVTACLLATVAGLDGYALTAVPLVLGVAGAAVVWRRQLPLLWVVPPTMAAAVVMWIMERPFQHIPGTGVLGFDVANDAVVHAIFAQYIEDGRTAPVSGTGFAQVVASYHTGYPSGAHELVAAVARPGGGVLASYDATLAAIMAVGAFGAYWLLRRTGVPRGLSALGAALACGGYLQFGYYSEGFLPQLAATPLVLGSIGLGYEAARGGRRAPAALSGVCLGGALAVYSAAVAVYVAPALAACAIGSVVFTQDRLRRLRGLTVQAGLLVAGTLLALAPVLRPTLDFIRGAQGAVEDQTSAGSRGNLPHAVDAKTVLGAWIGPDFRVAYTQIKPSQAAMLAAAALLVAGVVAALARHRPALPLVLGAFGLASLIVSHRSGIYYTAKSYQMLAVPVACAVVAGAWALVEGRRGVQLVALGLVATLLLGGWTLGVKRSLGTASAAVAVTPAEVHELVSLRPLIGQQRALVLLPDDWAKFALPTSADPLDRGFVGDAPEPAPGRGDDGFYDVSSFAAPDVDRYPAIVEPSVGGLAMLPAPYRVVEQTPATRLWRRPSDRMPPEPREPLVPAGELGGTPVLPGQTSSIALRTTPGRVLLGGGPLDGLFVSPTTWKLSGTGWSQWDADQRFVVSTAPADAHVTFSVADPGVYDAWMIGIAGGGFELRVDGHPLASPDRGTLSSRRRLGSIRLRAGYHRLDLIGTPSVSYVRAIALQRQAGPSRPVEVCVGNQRAPLDAAHPTWLTVPTHAKVRNCGDRPLRLYWVAAPGTTS